MSGRRSRRSNRRKRYKRRNRRIDWRSHRRGYRRTPMKKLQFTGASRSRNIRTTPIKNVHLRSNSSKTRAGGKRVENIRRIPIRMKSG